MKLTRPSFFCRGPTSSKSRNHLAGKQLLLLERLPVLETAIVGQDVKLSNSGFFLKPGNFINNLRWATNKSNILLNQIVIRKLKEGFKRSTSIETIPCPLQLLWGMTNKFHSLAVIGNEIKQIRLTFLPDLGRIIT